MENNSGTAMSPSSRTRLVVASQSLEIQHLHEVIQSKERELQTVTTRLYDEKGDVEKQLSLANARVGRLEGQITLLGEKLREVEKQKESQLAEEVAMMSNLTQTGSDQTAFMQQLRDELRELRTQNASLNQERTIFAEQLAMERQRSSDLEAQIADFHERTAQQTHGGGGRPSTTKVIHRSAQTSDATAAGNLSPSRAADLTVEDLKCAIEFEKGQQEYFSSVAAIHSTNASQLTELVQRRIEQEMHRLQQEQDRYREMLSDWSANPSKPKGSHGGGGTPSGPQSSGGNTNDTTSKPLFHDPPSFSRGSNLNASAAFNSNLTFGSISAAHAATAAATSGSIPQASFVAQQQDEIHVLRQRLEDLQHRHRTVRGEIATDELNTTGRNTLPPPTHHASPAASSARSEYQRSEPALNLVGPSVPWSGGASAAGNQRLSRSTAQSAQQQKLGVQRLLSKTLSTQ